MATDNAATETITTAKKNKGTNQIAVRNYNEKLILQLIRKHVSLTKADATRETGLSPNAVSVIFRSLEDGNLLIKEDAIRGRRGQPSIPMSLNPDAAYFLGLKIGRRSLELIVVDFVGNTLNHIQENHEFPLPDASVAFVASAMSDLLAKCKISKTDIVGLGVAMPFELWHWTEEFGAPREKMEVWKTADLKAELSKVVDCPILIENDGTAACNAELVFGTEHDKQDFIYFFVGTIIGGGIVLNESVFRGREGTAGGFGPMPIPGKNHQSERLVDQASLFVLERMIAEQGGDPRSIYGDATGWTEYGEIVNEWVKMTARGLAYATVSSLSIIDFEAVIIDGNFPEFIRDQIVRETSEQIDELDLQGIRKPEFIPGSCGNLARAQGAASLTLSETYAINQNTLLRS
ncbi:ROK family transcriptional regulator [Labrenzia sp. DG1229]|uniref:ROK family transcriptional regulator n=1 Tax=Labrenzia sp. DG1229 TaxID=681847 RepID=UPI00048CB121|nr:ROK family transcriptional regulator [Labrenzia sp. DG1229]